MIKLRGRLVVLRSPVLAAVRGDAHAAIIRIANAIWIIRIDPDQVFPTECVDALTEVILSENQVAIISLPEQYYYGGKPLWATPWGGLVYSYFVFNRDRVLLSPLVHRRFDIKEGYELKLLPLVGDNYVRHYWVDSISQLFEKHWRYIKFEGEARYKKGERFSWQIWLRQTVRALKQSLIDAKGLQAGFTGVFLSVFYAWYVCMSLLSLRQYQRAI